MRYLLVFTLGVVLAPWVHRGVIALGDKLAQKNHA